METEELKVRIQEEVDAHRQELIDLSLKIHANPELGWREEKASAWLAALKIKDRLQGKKVVLVISGGNISMQHLRAALDQVEVGSGDVNR